MKKDNKSEAAILREKAEDILKKKSSKSASHLSDVEALKLIHELEVHQVELEIQNKELELARSAAQLAAEKYIEIYDFAPSCYFTLSEAGKIIELNLSGANMLGKERSRLKNSLFGFFVSNDTIPIFNLFLGKVFKSKIKETCEVILTTNANLHKYFHITGIATEDGKQCLVTIEDITERKEIEVGLEKTRQELAVIKISADEVSEFAENIINTVREPLLALDHDLRVVKASRSFYDFFKVTPDETIGTLIYDLGNHQWNIPKLRELLETILPEKATFNNYEVEHEFSTIGKRIMLLNARQIKRGLGKEKIILLAIEDITERKEIEAGLEKTRQELAVIKISADEVSEFAENIINTVREPLLALDHDLRVVKASRSFYDFFKVTSNETIGKLIYDLGNHQWNIPKLRELLETILPKKATFNNYEVEHEFSTIGKRIMLLNARQIKRGTGKEKVILLAIQDITERKQAEEALAGEQYLMGTLMDNLPDHIYFKDLESKFVRINKSHALKFGFDDPAQVLGKSDFDFFSGEHSQQAYDDEQTIIRTGQPLIIEEKETYSDHPDNWVSTIKMPLYNKEGKIIGTFGISRDIAKQKLAQEEIKHKNEELQNLNAEKDKFFSIIAHDLRSPLSSFLGFTQLLVEELPSMELTDLQEMAVSMEKSASNLYRLIENLLEWAKMQRGLVPFKPEVIQLNSIVGESVEMLMESVKNKKIDIINDISDDIIVIADANMLKTIIRNFVSNAVKFSSREGKINISAKTSGSESIEISIQDSGIGMSPAMLEHLFQLNNQTNRIGTEGEPSSGLGLLLCKEFIEKLGGQIRVESEVGKGTEFIFMLPRPVDKEENKVPEKIGLVDQVKIPVHLEVSGLKILIADDDIASEMIIALIIRGFGKEILKVRTGTEAVKACRNNPDIDLVLMDIQMPEMDGYEATRQIRKFNKDVIIVAQAGFVSDNDKELAIEAGCNDYISKPIKKAELLGLVQKYFTK